MERTIYVAQSYTVRLDRVRSTTPNALIRDTIADHANRRANLRAEFVNAKPEPMSRIPCERHEDYCKFFFDYDQTVEDTTSVDENTLNLKKEDLYQEVMSILETSVGATPGSYTVHTAQRHGPLPGNKYKTSFRFFVSGYRTTPYSIKNAIINRRLPNSFDLSVYSRNRRLCMIMGTKTKNDPRQLLPHEDDILDYRTRVPDKDPLTEPDFLKNYLALYVEDDWPIMNVDLEDNHNDSQNSDDDTIERPPRARRSIPQAASFETIRELLKDTGFTNPRQVHPCREEGDQVHVAFDCEARDDCPICHRQHEHQNWLALISTKRGVAVRNLSDNCFLVPLMSDHFLYEPIKQIKAEGGSIQEKMAKWYYQSREGTLRFHQGTGMFHEFKDQKWTMVPDELVTAGAIEYLMHQLIGSQIQRMNLWMAVADKLGMSETATKPIKKLKKVTLAAYKSAGTYSTIAAVVRILRGISFADSLLFDRNHDLLHFSNGVLDLNTKEFRDAQPGDYNTLTTGYDYDPNPSEQAKIFHREFINKVYPDPAIREVAQRVMGSTLSGHNHAKKLFIFTDNGGEMGGNNGKTQVFRLHQMTLGDYAVIPKKEVLYDGQSNAEAANPNMAKLRGKRAATVEELEPHKKLAEGLVKEITNGTNPVFPVRDLYKSTTMMEVCAKMMIGCNHGKFPRFDPYDEALTNRFLPVPHISHFTTESSKWDPVHHVYPADADVAEKMNDPEHRMAHMLWCLEGYDNYKRLRGFSPDTLPSCILDFKRVLIFKNTPVYAYLGEVLEETDRIDRDFLTMQTVWELYKKDRRSNKYLTMEQFASSFRVYVNSKIPNSFQYQRSGSNSVPFARGFKIRPDAGECGSFRPGFSDADNFM